MALTIFAQGLSVSDGYGMILATGALRILSVAPDIAVIKGHPFQPINSWRIGRTGPSPHVVLGILSGETWRKDVEEKPEVYARMGVQEYFAYDPNLSPLAEETTRRLFGWRLDRQSQHMVALPLPPEGYLWSCELDSFLVPDEQLMHLYDRNGQLRLTRAEALAEKLRSLGFDPDQV